MKITRYISAAIAFSALTACQNDDVLDNTGYSHDPDAVVVKSAIGGLQSRANTSGTGDKFEPYDRIHVSNVTEGAVAGKDKAVYDCKYDLFGNAGWEPLSQDKYIVWVDGENRFEAYYPYAGNVTASYSSFTLPTDQSNNTRGQDGYIGYADWMTAEVQSVKTVDNTISLSFKHRLARVSVKITGYNTQYGGSLPEISAPVFSVPAVERDAAVTVADDAEVKGLMLADESESKLHSFMAVLPAGKYSSDATLMKVNVGEQVLTVRPSSYLIDTGLEAGTSYTVNLSVGKNTASISGITVADWNEGWNENGTAEEESAKVENSVITTAYPGQLTADVLDKATASGLEMTIKGSDLSADDFNILSAWLREKFYEDNTRQYSITLEDATELPENALYTVDYSYVVALASFKAPKVSKIHQNAFKYVKIGEIWLTKAGTVNVHEGWFEAINGASENIPTFYLNADKRIDGAGSPTVSTWTFYDTTLYSWVTYGTHSKDYWRFVDEAGNITDWDGNPVTN